MSIYLLIIFTSLLLLLILFCISIKSIKKSRYFPETKLNSFNCNLYKYFFFLSISIFCLFDSEIISSLYPVHILLVMLHSFN